MKTVSGSMVSLEHRQVHKLPNGYYRDCCVDLNAFMLNVYYQFKSINVIGLSIWKPVIWFAC